MIDGSSSNDEPLAFHWHAIDEGWIDVLGLPPALSKAYAQARASIVLEALITERLEPERWISYSRSKGWYAHGQRYRGTCYTFSTVPRAVDELERLGLIEHDRAPVGRLGWQSRFRATPALIRAVAIPVVVYDPGETIRLKDEHDNLRDYRETDVTIRMRRNLVMINEALRAEQIGICGVEGPIATIAGRPLSLGQDQLHRVFNRGSFSLGGRMYGPFWQNLPKAVRSDLIISGKGTDEEDYSQLHPRMLYALYAEAGAVLEGDAYELDGWDRPLVKRAFNIAINADTEVAAIRAIAQEIGGEGAYTKARRLLEAIRARHRPIGSSFGSGAGLRLQRRDADLAERVTLRLLNQNIVVLSIHDSFVVQTRHALVRDEIMDDELQKLVAKLPTTTKSAVPATPCAESVPHNGDSAVSPPFLILVSERAFAFGGLAPFEVAASMLEGWGGGVAPEPVRVALRHEIEARGLTQERLAREVGLSRPQLTNLLVGRFGTSPEVVSRLKAFLLAA
jgi:hypothetical protein